MIDLDPGKWEELVLPYLDRAISRLLEFDPETRQSLAQLDGRVVAIEVDGIGRKFYLFPGSNGLSVRFNHDGSTHVRIRGTLAGYFTLARCRVRGEPIPAGTVEIVGDLSTAQLVQNIIGQLDIDWEEMVSRVIGDTAARKLGVLARDLREWLRASRQSMESNVSEYVRYESGMVPERDAVEEFMHGVDVLRADSDRLAERVQRLERLLAGRSVR